jgi:hypothetical protein
MRRDDENERVHLVTSRDRVRVRAAGMNTGRAATVPVAGTIVSTAPPQAAMRSSYGIG